MKIYPGMKVVSSQGPLGAVSEVGTDPAGGPGYVVIEGSDGQQRQVQLHSWRIEHDVLLIDPAPEQSASHGGSAREARVPVATPDTLQAEVAQLAPGQALKVPVVAEQAVVERRQVEGGGVRIHKTVHERQEVVEHPVTREDVDVQRVPINQYVETAPPIREEGDTTIIPVLEEVLVAEKRLVLKEEIHLTRRRSTTPQQTTVTLREEHVELEPIPPPSDHIDA